MASTTIIEKLVVIFLVTLSSDAVIVRRTFDVSRSNSARGSSRILLGRLFGFKRGGHLRLNVDCWQGASRPCSSSQSWSEAFNVSANRLPQSPITSPQFELFETFGFSNRSSMYNFVIRECPPFDENLKKTVRTSCQVLLEAVNPGGEHLSRDQIPLPNIYMAIVIVWAFVIVAWCMNWIRYRRYANGLHAVISAAPTIKLVTLILEYRKYSTLSSQGWVPDDLEITRSLLLFAETALFLSSILLISYGWKVLRRELEGSTLFATVGLPLLLLLSNVCQRWVHSYFTGLSIILVLCITVTIIRSSGLHVIILRHRLMDISFIYRREMQDRVQMSINQFASPLLRKLALFQATRLIFVLFAIAWTILELSASFLHEHTWIRILTLECVEMVTYLVLMVVFREPIVLYLLDKSCMIESLRDFSPYEKKDASLENISDIEVTLYELKEGHPFALLVPMTPELFLEFIRNRIRTRDTLRDREHHLNLPEQEEEHEVNGRGVEDEQQHELEIEDHEENTEDGDEGERLQ
eukprot:gene7303-7673_t